MKNPTIRHLLLTLLAIVICGQLDAQTLSNLGGTAPTPGANDISQLSTQGNKTNPDGLNYYTDNYTSWGNGEPGQTFTTGANAGGYVLTSLALKTGGIGSSSGTTTPQPYYLHIYSVSGNTATLLQTYTSGNVAFNDGNWLQWTGLSVPLSPNTTYAYSFGKASSTSSYEPLAVATNKYAGGEIAQIKPNTGGVTYGSSHTFDAVFNVGLVLATTPNVGTITLSPWTNVPAGVQVTFAASVVGALPLTNQWQFDNGGGFVNVSGANTNPLSFVSAVTNTGSYRLVLANSYGAVTSAPVAFAVSPGFTNIPASMPFPLPTYGFNIGNKLELGWGAPNPAVLYNAAYNGFNAVRVPCRWDQSATTNISGGVTNYPINPSYMAQVKQTVDAAIAAGMYVMINDHEDWLQANITTNIDPIIDAKMNSYFSQIATTFAGYDNHLLFAAANEPNVHSPDEMKSLMYYYQTFVNAVRAVGGNNTNRWLVLQAGGDTTWLNALPTDTVTNRLMVEYHNYTPSLFSIIHTDQGWGTAIYYWGPAYHYSGETNRNATGSEEGTIDAGYQQLADLYVSKGIPVMIGEFGASPTANASATIWNQDSVLYWDKYLAESARVHGLSPFYWSTGGDPFDYDTGATTKAGPMIAVTGGTVPPPPNGAPYAASGLIATLSNNTNVILSWTAGSGATSYNLYRGTTSGDGSVLAPIVTGITGTSYTNTGLANGTTYYYQVVAVNASGLSGFSPEAKATTSGTAPITDLAQFNFESTAQGWYGGGGMISGVAQSTAQHYAGTGALAVNFNGTISSNSSVAVGNVSILPGVKVTFRLWIPSGHKISLIEPYVSDRNYNWSSGWYNNFTANAWNTFSQTVPANFVPPLQSIGLRITTSDGWTNTCYLDSVIWTNPAPDFTLSASPTSLTVNAGTNGNSTITVMATNGLNACYMLSVSNLPSGVSATFTNNPNIGGQSLLTLTASNNVVSGTTNVTVIATAGLISHTKTIALTLNSVVQPNTPPVLAAIANQTVNVGQTVAFTAGATDTDSPPQTLTFSLLAGPGTATLNSSSGAFSWTPQVGDAGTTNLFSIKVADNGTPSLSATQSFYVTVSAAAPIKVACVGDSITAGYGLASPGTQSYPAQLQTLLGSGYTVNNYGNSGTTALKTSDNTYWNSWAYNSATNSSPDIVVIMFGANDSKSWNWNAANFNTDYRALISVFTNLATHPKVFACYTPPMYLPTAFGTTFDPVFIENTVEPAIATIATQAGVQLIDNDTPLLNRQDLFQDGVHPTTAGAAIVAQTVYNAIKGLAPTNITSAAISSSLNPSVAGSNVTFTATLTSSSGTVTGAVVFAANNVPFSTNTLVGGTASVTNSQLSIGANVVAAQYVSQGKFLGSTRSLQQVVTDPNGPTLANLGSSAPIPGTYDIYQLSTQGNTAWPNFPDGINYYTDNNSPVGQTFTTGTNAVNLTTVAIKTGGLDSGSGYGTPGTTPTYYLRLYSVSNGTATLLNAFSAANPGFTDGDWLKWSGLNVPLATNQTYAYTFGIKPSGGGYCALAVATNKYDGGEIAVIPINGGTITNGSSHSFDATFVLGMVGNTPPALAAITNRTVNVGQTVALTASATDTDSPPQTLTFALLAGATNATLNPNSGAFSFRPLVTQANSTNNFTLKVSDNGTPSLSATQSFAVVVNPLAAPAVSSVSVAGGQFSISISGQSGPDYAVETSTNLTQWSNVFITNSPALPFNWTDATTNAPQRFYRIKLGPPLS